MYFLDLLFWYFLLAEMIWKDLFVSGQKKLDAEKLKRKAKGICNIVDCDMLYSQARLNYGLWGSNNLIKCLSK